MHSIHMSNGQSLHNPLDGIYNFEGMANITHFLDLAAAEGFLVILRPGPYICAERDNVRHYLNMISR